MEIEALVQRYPILYHMAEDGSCPSLKRNGLLSTSALLDKFEIQGEQRRAIESSRRPEMVRLDHPEHGTAFIRDNKPMSESAVRRCLTGMTSQEWYETLNRRVFFWVDRSRLLKLLGARAYRDRPHLVLEVDTAELLRCHAERVTLSSINSGATFNMKPAPRGPETFCRIAEYPASKPVVELAVDYAALDIAKLVISVSRWQGPEKLGEVWHR